MSSKENFSSAGISVTARGANAAADVSVGSTAGATTISNSLIVNGGLAGALQGSAGAGSKATVSVSGGTSIALPSQISVAADAASSSATLNLKVNPLGQLTAGAPAAPGLITIRSAGYNSESTMRLQTEGQGTSDGLAAILNADLVLRRSAKTSDDAARNSTSFITGTNTRSIDIGGNLDMQADTAAVNGIVAAGLNASATGAALVHIAGGVAMRAEGYNSRVDLDVSIIGGAIAGTVGTAQFIVDRNLSVVSSRAGDLSRKSYGAIADISVKGSAASIQVKGDWITRSEGDLGIARSTFTLDSMGASPGTTSIAGNLRVEAVSYGSEAAVLFNGVGSSSLTVGGRVDISAQALGAQASLSLVTDTASTLSASGNISVSAGAAGTKAEFSASGSGSWTLASGEGLSISASAANAVAKFSSSTGMALSSPVRIVADSGAGASSGAYASMVLSGANDLGINALFSIDAVRAADTAVLDMQLVAPGGKFVAGSSGSAGNVYLTFSRLLPSEIDLDFGGSGVAHLALKTEDRDLSMSGPNAESGYQTLVGSMLTIKDFRRGIDQLSFLDPQNPAAQFVKGLNSGVNDLREFAQHFVVVSSGSPVRGPVYIVGESLIPGEANVFYIAYDYDGRGITGLIRLEGVSGYVQASDWVPPPATPVFNAANPARVPFTIARTGSTANQDLAITAGTNEEGTLSVSNDALISMRSLSASAAGTMSSAVVRLSGMAPTVRVDNDFTLHAGGLYSNVDLSSFPGPMDQLTINGKYSAIADGDHSNVSFSLLSARGPAISLSDTVRLAANGVDSEVSFTAYSGSMSLSLGKGGIIEANGAGAKSALNFKDVVLQGLHAPESFFSGGLLSAVASGADAAALGAVSVQRRISVSAGGAGAIASGESSEARIQLHSITQFDVGNSGPGVAVAGNISASASALAANAAAELSSKTGISVEGGIRAAASAKDADATVYLGSLDQSVRTGALSALSSGVNSTSDVMISVARFFSQPMIEILPGGAAVQVGRGDIVSGSGAATVAGKLEAVAGSLQSSAGIRVFAYAGNVNIGTAGSTSSAIIAEAAGSESVAQVTVEGGSNGIRQRDAVSVDILTGTGSLTVNGSTAIVASGAAARAAAALSSNNAALQQIGSVQVLASGDGSSATYSARSRWLMTEESNNVLAPLTINGNITVAGAGISAEAVADVISGRGALSTGGLAVSALSSGATAKASMSTSSGTMTLSGDVSATAAGSSGQAVVKLHAGLSGQAVPGGGNITLSQSLVSVASGTHSSSECSVTASSAGTIRVGQFVEVRAAGDHAAARLVMGATGLEPANGPAALSIDGSLVVDASATRATARAEIAATAGGASTGAISVLAGGAESLSLLSLSAKNNLTIGGGVQGVASAYRSVSDITLSATGTLTINGSVDLFATGDAARLKALLLNPSGGITVNGDVRVGALADGSEASLTLVHVATSGVPVSGTIHVMADSGSHSVAGASVSAGLLLNRFADAPTNLVIAAAESLDRATAGLTLNAAGGSVQLGGDGQAGTAELNLIGRYLVDDVSISFQGSAGKAVLGLRGQDVNATTASGIGLMEVDGFRVGQDVIRFYSENKAMTAVSSGQGTSEASFRADALSYFADTAVDKGLYARSIGSAMYLAYDYDGNGVDGIVVLDDVSLVQFREYLSTTGLG